MTASTIMAECDDGLASEAPESVETNNEAGTRGGGEDAGIVEHGRGGSFFKVSRVKEEDAEETKGAHEQGESQLMTKNEEYDIQEEGEDGEDEEGSSSSNEEEKQVVETYTLDQLATGCPEGVKPFEKEKHLAADDFERIDGVDQPRFHEYPKWKRDKMKRDTGLH